MSRGERRREPVAVVTGASSGIGAETARILARRGYRVVLAARRAERLEALAATIESEGGRALVRAVDLSEPGAAQAMIEGVAEELGGLDVLINNAGFGQQVRFEEMPLEDLERMFRVDVLALMEASRAAIPAMRRSGGGAIVNIASVGGVVSHPLNVAYCAAKHAVVGFSKALRLELWGSGVSVVALCPGATETAFFEEARREIPFDPLIARNMVPAALVAGQIVKAIGSRRALIFPTWGAWLLAFADKWFPPLSELGNLRYRDRVLKMTARARPR